MSGLDFAVLVGYLVGMTVIGILCRNRNKRQEDYFMGGRSFGKVLQAFAAFGAGTGSSDPVNTARTSFTSGLSGMWSVMYWLFVTPFYWITAVWYRRMRHLTLGDWFVERYQSRALGAAYAVFGLLFFMVYTSMLLSAIGKVAAPLMGNTLAFGGHEVAIEYVLVPVIATVVIVYGVVGGISAAYFTDLVQGLCIVLLSILLVPFGLAALVEKFGDPGSQGLLAGFTILHQQLGDEYFRIVGTSRGSDFPLLLIVAVVITNLVGIVVTPHFIATGGGTARNEFTARVGLVAGNFAKRFCTVGWAVTALIILALLADSPELAADPDKAWGVGSRELLAPLGLGLVGLMLACLLAALMSSADCYMIVSSALIVRNLYAPYVNANASEHQYVRVGRLAGAVMIVGAVAISLYVMDVFKQLMLTWIVPLVFAAPFWIGMYWRRATTAAAWITVVYGLLAFFALPILLPVAFPGLRTNPAYAQTNYFIESTTVRAASPADVARRRAAISLWEQSRSKAEAMAEPAARAETLAELGDAPQPIATGDSVTDVRHSGGSGMFWSGGIEPVGDARFRVVEERRDGDTITVVKAYDCPLRGKGRFNLDLVVCRWLGVELAPKSDAMLRALGLPFKIVVPFLVMLLASVATRPNASEALDRFYVKMKTPVRSDPDEDREEVARSYADPSRFDARRLFPNTGLEFQKPTAADVWGFVISFLVCFLVIGLAVWVAGIGAA